MAMIGVQAMMLRTHVAEQGPYAVWKRLAELGFHAIEVSQIDLTEQAVAEIVRANGEFGTKTAALSATMAPATGHGNKSLLDQLDEIVADCQALGSQRVRIGMMPLHALASREALVDFAHQTEEKVKRLADDGIRLSYHNHHVEFARFGRERVLDILRAEAPSLWFELDVHWIHRGGGDPVRVLSEFDGVVDLVHLKDYRIALPTAEQMAALQAGDRQGFADYWSTCVQFAEVGAGNLDFAGIVDQGVRSGAEYLLIEQDDQYGRDIFDCLADSRANLVELGYESML